MSDKCFYDNSECLDEKNTLIEMFTSENEKVKHWCCKKCLKVKLPNNLILQTNEEQLKKRKCPNCSSNILDIIGSSKIGCPLCYSYFYNEIKILVQNCQGLNNENLGKTPNGMHHKSALVACVLKDLEKIKEDPEIVEQLKEYLKNY